MKKIEWKLWEILLIGYAILTIILAIIGYYVKAVEPLSDISTYILVIINCVIIMGRINNRKKEH